MIMLENGHKTRWTHKAEDERMKGSTDKFNIFRICLMEEMKNEQAELFIC